MSNDRTTPLNFHLRACREGNADLLEQAFVPGGRFVGTDDSEGWLSGDLVQMLRDNPGGWRMDLTRRYMFSVSSTVTEFLEFVNHVTYGPMRGSGLVVLHEGRWRINSYVLSCSVSNSALEGEDLSKYMRLIGAT